MYNKDGIKKNSSKIWTKKIKLRDNNVYYRRPTALPIHRERVRRVRERRTAVVRCPPGNCELSDPWKRWKACVRCRQSPWSWWRRCGHETCAYTWPCRATTLSQCSLPTRSRSSRCQCSCSPVAACSIADFGRFTPQKCRSRLHWMQTSEIHGLMKQEVIYAWHSQLSDKRLPV